MKQFTNPITFLVLLSISIMAFAQDGPPGDSATEARKQLREEMQQREQDTYTKLQITELSKRCDATLAALDKLTQASNDVQKRANELLINDDGKKIAADDICVKAFIEFQDRPIFDQRDLEQKVTATNALRDDLAKVQKEPPVGYTPDVQRKLDTDAAYAWANDKLSKVNQFSNLLSTTVKNTPAPAANTKTLGSVIDAFHLKQLTDLTAARQAGVDAAKGPAAQVTMDAAKAEELQRAAADAQRKLKEAQEQIERANLESDRKLQELKLSQQEALVRAQITAEQKQADLQSQLEQARLAMKQKQATEQIANAKQDEGIDKQKMIAKCQSREVQDLLRPFTTPGRWNPPHNNTVTKRPMSLSALESFGALKDTDEGLVKLADCCNKFISYKGSNFWSHDDDRPKIGITADVNKWTDGDIAKLKQMQATLSELGPTLVELKMLDP